MPITWKNINSGSDAAAVNLLNQAGAQVNQGLGSLTNTLQGLQGRRQDRHNTMVDANTQKVLDRLQSFRTPEELQAAQDSGELASFIDGVGPVNREQLRGASDRRLATLRDQLVAGQQFEDGQTNRANQDYLKRAQLDAQGANQDLTDTERGNLLRQQLADSGRFTPQEVTAAVQNFNNFLASDDGLAPGDQAVLDAARSAGMQRLAGSGYQETLAEDYNPAKAAADIVDNFANSERGAQLMEWEGDRQGIINTVDRALTSGITVTHPESGQPVQVKMNPSQIKMALNQLHDSGLQINNHDANFQDILVNSLLSNGGLAEWEKLQEVQQGLAGLEDQIRGQAGLEPRFADFLNPGNSAPSQGNTGSTGPRPLPRQLNTQPSGSSWNPSDLPQVPEQAERSGEQTLRELQLELRRLQERGSHTR